MIEIEKWNGYVTENPLLKYLAFVKTVETGSFTRAAQALSYAQSSSSKMVADLEQEWGMTLLERSKSVVCLTSAGAQVLPFLRRLLQEQQALEGQISRMNGVETGVVRIGTFSSGAIHWVPNIIKAFQKDYPGIDYELLLGDYTEIEDWIAQGRVDCGFLRLPTRTDFDTIPLGRDRLLAILPQNHPLTQYDRVPIAALAEEPFMLLEKGAQAEVSQVFQRHGLKPRVHFTTWDDYAIMAMVESGLGVSMLTEMILKRVPFNVVVKELDVTAYRETALAIREQETASLAVKKFMGYLQYR